MLVSTLSGAAHLIDQRAAIARQGVAAPRDMAIGADQHEFPLKQSRRVFIVEIDHAERDAPVFGGCLQRADVGASCAEPQQDKPLAKQIEGRFALLDPDMGYASAGPGRWFEPLGPFGRRGAVIDADRRALVTDMRPQLIGDRQAAQQVLIALDCGG